MTRLLGIFRSWSWFVSMCQRGSDAPTFAETVAFSKRDSYETRSTAAWKGYAMSTGRTWGLIDDELACLLIVETGFAGNSSEKIVNLEDQAVPLRVRAIPSASQSTSAVRVDALNAVRTPLQC